MRFAIFMFYTEFRASGQAKKKPASLPSKIQFRQRIPLANNAWLFRGFALLSKKVILFEMNGLFSADFPDFRRLISQESYFPSTRATPVLC